MLVHRRQDFMPLEKLMYDTHIDITRKIYESLRRPNEIKHFTPIESQKKISYIRFGNIEINCYLKLLIGPRI